jgi:hypothetical protein
MGGKPTQCMIWEQEKVIARRGNSNDFLRYSA